VHISPTVLIEALRRSGLRVTAARRAICEVIAASHGEHLDAAAIHARVSATGINVDQSTVYRSLDALEDAGLLTHTHLGHGAAVYHLSEEAAHQHFVCSECGATVAIPAAAISDFLSEVETQTGFVVDPSHFAIGGRCAACAG
jgi:Fur family ferric uptake transcriptional regulator